MLLVQQVQALSAKLSEQQRRTARCPCASLLPGAWAILPAPSEQASTVQVVAGGPRSCSKSTRHAHASLQLVRAPMKS